MLNIKVGVCFVLFSFSLNFISFYALWREISKRKVGRSKRTKCMVSRIGLALPGLSFCRTVARSILMTFFSMIKVVFGLEVNFNLFYHFPSFQRYQFYCIWIIIGKVMRFLNHDNGFDYCMMSFQPLRLVLISRLRDPF